ncbi:SDR family NAD(P)-dependent oxidoreductase [Paraflavisolibacter sp. H34]|uniref:SDR family NAD(P)-dependent oxidoreductase n=1 Tax=Huijunlia imazamoxiresistens TaxID=3127457 RepID=UPI00301B186C
MKKTVFITGATSGFGEACADKFAANGYNLLLNGRRQERLENLRKRLEEQYKVSCYTLPFDVRVQEDVFAAVEGLPEEWKTIDVLVNNAGLALGRDLFQDASLEDWNIMIDTNVKGLLYVSRAVTPLMMARGHGHVINMGSIAGKEVYEKGNVYCASKFAVDAISKAMRVDLLPYRIKVTAIHPGAAETEFSLVRFKGNEAAARKIYEGYQPLSAADVAEVVYFTASLPAHVCINDLVLTPTQQANSFYLHKD